MGSSSFLMAHTPDSCHYKETNLGRIPVIIRCLMGMDSCHYKETTFTGLDSSCCHRKTCGRSGNMSGLQDYKSFPHRTGCLDVPCHSSIVTRADACGANEINGRKYRVQDFSQGDLQLIIAVDTVDPLIHRIW